MSNNIVYSPDEADNLNELVRNTIAGHLFITCNYNPESISVFNEDAKFMQAVLNLYKFLFDASICVYLQDLDKKYHIQFDFKKMKDIFRVIKAMRTLISHNVDFHNGSEEPRIITEEWFQDAIGKKQPDSIADYKQALTVLEQHGAEIVSVITDFIKKMGEVNEKEEVVSDWEKSIICFYQRPNSRNILEGQLKLAFQAKIADNTKPNRVNISIWTKNILTDDSENRINSIRKLIQQFKDKNPETSKIQPFTDMIILCEKVLNEKNSQIASHFTKDANELSKFDYLNYYLDLLPKRIEDIIHNSSLPHNITLLPQDVVQLIIDKDSKDISVR
ncbi:MAG: hypothetical protein IJ601_02685 [Acidaminococcaceae bacterium]|nr:hypothetical protein [Acidaminococcaceae bacterium]